MVARTPKRGAAKKNSKALPKKSAAKRTPATPGNIPATSQPRRRGEDDDLFDEVSHEGECMRSELPPELSGCNADEACICGTAMIRN